MPVTDDTHLTPFPLIFPSFSNFYSISLKTSKSNSSNRWKLESNKPERRFPYFFFFSEITNTDEQKRNQKIAFGSRRCWTAAKAMAVKLLINTTTTTKKTNEKVNEPAIKWLYIKKNGIELETETISLEVNSVGLDARERVKRTVNTMKPKTQFQTHTHTRSYNVCIYFFSFVRFILFFFLFSLMSFVVLSASECLFPLRVSVLLFWIRNHTVSLSTIAHKLFILFMFFSIKILLI